MASAKWRLFRLGLNELTETMFSQEVGMAELKIKGYQVPGSSPQRSWS